MSEEVAVSVPTKHKVATAIRPDEQAPEPAAPSSASLRHELRQPLNHRIIESAMDAIITLDNDLVESELFGHEKGPFGALARKLGRFELADQGTLFLDEVGELPLAVQAKLLRVVQEGEFERVGRSETRKVDVRIIADTNRDLASQVKEGGFRPDLFYRLNVFPITFRPYAIARNDTLDETNSFNARLDLGVRNCAGGDRHRDPEGSAGGHRAA